MSRIKSLWGCLLLAFGIVPPAMERCGVWTGYAGERSSDMETMLCPVLLEDIKVREDWNARRLIPEEDIRGLKYSMDNVGQLNVISVVRRPDGKFDLLAGEKRLIAAQQSKRRQIDARVFDKLTPEQELRVMLDENLVRVPLNVIEEALAYSRLMEFRTIDQVASLYCRTPEYIRGRLDLLELQPEVQRMMVRKNNPLRIHQAEALARVKDQSVQLKLARRVAMSTAQSNEPVTVLKDWILEERGQGRLPVDPPSPKKAKRRAAVQEATTGRVGPAGAGEAPGPADVRPVTHLGVAAGSVVQDGDEAVVAAESDGADREERVEAHLVGFLEGKKLPFKWDYDSGGDSGNWLIVDSDGCTVIDASGTQFSGMEGNGVDEATARWVCRAMNHFAEAITLHGEALAKAKGGAV